MATLTFVKPQKTLEPEIMAFMQQFYDAGETVVNGCGGLDVYRDFDVWLAYLHRIEAGDKDVFCPSHIRLAKDGEEIVGIVDIRPDLPKEKEDFGHIGYAVAPKARGRGYATAIMAWAEAELKKAGLKELLVDCYETNAASKRVIEKSGFTERRRYPDADDGRTVIEFSKTTG